MSIIETPEVYNYVKDILQKKDPTVFEIGANDGLDTREILKYCNGDYRYFCFECDPRSAEYVRSLNLPITFTEEAISNFVGTSKFYTFSAKNDDKDLGAMGPSSLLEPLPYEHWLPHLKHDVIEVKTNTLDSFCEYNKVYHIDFLWVDAQGSEYNIIDGGIYILENTEWVFMECMKNAQYKNQKLRGDLINSLTKFEVVVEWENDILFRKK